MFRSALLRVLPTVALACVLPAAAEEKGDAKAATDAPKKLTFDDDVLPIFQSRCGSCHNAADRRGGLQLDDYAALMQGGGSGDVVYAGDVDSSYLWMVVNHDEEPVMPPNAPRIPDAELAIIRGWIDQGILENAGSKAKKKKVNPALAKVEVSFEKPDGPLAPSKYLGDPALVPPRGNSVTALAVSPWASIAAVSGHEQVTLWDLNTSLPLGTLPFPEGQPHVLRFSRNGKVLLAAGGRGGMRGEAVLFDVLTGERIGKAGNEYDAILAADVSPDLSLVAVGGPKKLLRVHDTASNEVVWEADKHTDWLMHAAFSPDGVLLASGDRSGGCVVWEAETGREFYVLNQHKAAITGIAWRADGNVLATACDDRSVRLFDMNSGKEVKKFDAGVAGITALAYSRDGRLLVTGRNRAVRAFDAAGKVLKEFPKPADLGLNVAWDNEGNRALVGDWTGTVTVHPFDNPADSAKLKTNVPRRDALKTQFEGELAQATQELERRSKSLKGLQDALQRRKAAAESAKAQREAAAAMIAKRQAEKTAAAEAVRKDEASLGQTRAAIAKVKDGQAKLAAAAAATTAKRPKAAAALDAAEQAVRAATDAVAAAEAANAKAKQSEATPEALAASAKMVEQSQAMLATATTARDQARKTVQTIDEAIAKQQAAQAEQAASLKKLTAASEAVAKQLGATKARLTAATAQVAETAKPLQAAKQAEVAAAQAAAPSEDEKKRLAELTKAVADAKQRAESSARRVRSLAEQFAADDAD